MCFSDLTFFQSSHKTTKSRRGRVNTFSYGFLLTNVTACHWRIGNWKCDGLVQERQALHLSSLSRSNRASPILKAVWRSIICHSINQDPAGWIAGTIAKQQQHPQIWYSVSAQEIMGWFLLPPEWKGRGDVYQSPAERNNALPWLPSAAHASLEKHSRCHRASHWGKGQARPRGPALRALSAPGVIYCLSGSDRGCGCEWEGDSDQMSAGPFQGSPHKCAGQLPIGAALCQSTVVTQGAVW